MNHFWSLWHVQDELMEFLEVDLSFWIGLGGLEIFFIIFKDSSDCGVF